jgi:hypothetical protein
MTLRLTGRGLCPSPGILNIENATFRKPDLFPSSDEGRKKITLLGLLVIEVSSF